MTIAAMVAAATKIDQAGTGYDQSQRWTFFTRPDGPINRNGEGDCSAVCGAIARLGGYPVDLSDNGPGGRFYTGTFKKRTADVLPGWQAIPYDMNRPLLDQIRTGDFTVTPGHHVEFVSGPGQMFSANADENGRAVGGQAGDQTGREVAFKKAYVFSRGWVWIIRPPADPKPQPKPTTPASGFVAGPTLSKGDTGSRVKKFQQIGIDKYHTKILDGHGGADGQFGDATVALAKAIQAFHNRANHAGLAVDGVVGPATQRAMYAFTHTNF